MLPFFLAGIIFVFLLLGSIVFLACLLIPRTRQYALSVALWCAMCGPCSVALMVIAGVGLITTAFVTKVGGVQSLHAPRLISSFGWAYLIIGVLMTTIAATGAAWVHQAAVKRLTFALFRLYAAAVSAGIGSVFGWCLGWWVMVKGWGIYGWLSWGVGMLVLARAATFHRHKGARGLRGSAPKNFTWISVEEFAGL
jgi:hypothetical protein